MTLLLFITLVTSYLSSVAGQSPCITPNGKIGKCVSMYDCSSLLKLTSSPSQAETKLLRKSFCKFKASTPQVSCPPNTCTTADGAEGACIGVNTYRHLLHKLQMNHIQEALISGHESRCEDFEIYRVCCASQPEPMPTPKTSSIDKNKDKCQLTAFPPEPSTECCGLDARDVSNRIFGGNSTAVDEYPWLAIIEYVKDKKTKLLCGGVLISGRYVMTAGHCLVGPVLNAGTPVGVRLGEYDTSNSGQDCVEVEGGGNDCNDGAITVPIEKTIPHPEYNPSSKLRRHDIALIRLARVVEFTDFIRPICLPTHDFTETSTVDVMLFAAGWGAFSNVQSSSKIKLKVGLPYVSYQNCQPSYNVTTRRVPLWNGQICAGGASAKNFCKGDSGSPLMRENGNRLELVGIVSFGPTSCGKQNVAVVYTKVFYYLPWIRSAIVY